MVTETAFIFYLPNCIKYINKQIIPMSLSLKHLKLPSHCLLLKSEAKRSVLSMSLIKSQALHETYRSDGHQVDTSKNQRDLSFPI